MQTQVGSGDRRKAQVTGYVVSYLTPFPVQYIPCKLGRFSECCHGQICHLRVNRLYVAKFKVVWVPNRSEYKLRLAYGHMKLLIQQFPQQHVVQDQGRHECVDLGQ